jgi:regulator of cell morphogenesis and NO signaling
MKMNVCKTSIVRGLARRYPEVRGVLASFGIRCDTHDDLETLARRVGVAVGAVIFALTHAGRDWSTARGDELVDYIERRHHDHMRRLLPRLETLIDRALEVHRLDRGEMLGSLRPVYKSLRSEVEEHMAAEENVLFPLIRRATSGSGDEACPSPAAMTGSPDENPVEQMRREHDRVDSALSGIRELTADYSLPEGADETLKRLYEGLQLLEADLREHIHLENDYLWPVKPRRPR